jgi:hypothetical protein
MKRSLYLAAVLLFAPAVAMGQDWWEDDFEDYPPIKLELNAWVAELDGTIEWGGNGLPGSEIDFVEDVDLDSSTANPYVRLNIGVTDRWDLRLSFWHTRHEGTADLEESLAFGGSTFPAGDQVQTEFSMDSYAMLLGYKFVDGEQLDLTLLFGAAVFRARMEMEDDNGVSAEEDSTIPSPVVGLAMNLDLSDSFTLRGQVVGMSLDTSDASGEAFDAEAALSWTLFEGLYITAGYKLFRADAEFDTDIEDKPNKGDFDIEGPFFGLGLVF